MCGYSSGHSGWEGLRLAAAAFCYPGHDCLISLAAASLAAPFPARVPTGSSRKTANSEKIGRECPIAEINCLGTAQRNIDAGRNSITEPLLFAENWQFSLRLAAKLAFICAQMTLTRPSPPPLQCELVSRPGFKPRFTHTSKSVVYGS